MNKEIKILYEDTAIIVCIKPAGIATQTAKIASKDMVTMLKNHIAKTASNGREPYLAVIHRLDQPVSGILIFAKTKQAAGILNKQMQTEGFGKYYKALLSKIPTNKEGILENYMIHDKIKNISRICDKKETGAKKACLLYKVESQKDKRGTWVQIELKTGRHHQIRVQMAGMDCPIVGDKKYNKENENTSDRLMLIAYKLEFTHPITKKRMRFEHMEGVDEEI